MVNAFGSMNLSVCHEAHGQVPMTHYSGLVNRRCYFTAIFTLSFPIFATTTDPL